MSGIHSNESDILSSLFCFLRPVKLDYLPRSSQQKMRVLAFPKKGTTVSRMRKGCFCTVKETFLRRE